MESVKNLHQQGNKIEVKEKSVNDKFSSGFQLHFIWLIVLGIVLIVAVIAMRRLL